MAYQHIDSLYKNQDILMFKECFAMEKVHGTSAHIGYSSGKLNFFSGGSKYESFISLFDQEALLEAFENHFGKYDETIEHNISCVVFGEAYGGKCQGMSATYGNQFRFIAFEVKIGSMKIGNMWLNVPKAEKICQHLGLDFVHYTKIPATLDAIDYERDLPSVQAVRNGMGNDKLREGIVLRPLEEFTNNNGERVIAKHKGDAFKETQTSRHPNDILIRKVEIADITNEWVTEERLNHILNRGVVEERIEDTGKIISLMVEDVCREGKGEIKDSLDLRKAIGRETALMFKRRLNRICVQ